MSKKVYIPGRIQNAAVDEEGNRLPVAGAEDIDAGEGKNQQQVNKDVNDALTLHQQEINALDGQNYVTVTAYSSLPTIGAVNTIYRVSSYDGTQVDATKYAEYAWNGSTYVLLDVKTQVGEVFDISQYRAVGGTLATFDNLADALDSGNNIPQSLRKGGMSVKFVQSSDNKYVQFRYMSSSNAIADFTNIANWQGVDDEPIEGSKNLIDSNAVAQLSKNLTDFGGKTSFEYENEYSISSKSGNFSINLKKGVKYRITLTKAESNYALSYIKFQNSNDLVIWVIDDYVDYVPSKDVSQLNWTIEFGGNSPLSFAISIQGDAMNLIEDTNDSLSDTISSLNTVNNSIIPKADGELVKALSLGGDGIEFTYRQGYENDFFTDGLPAGTVVNVFTREIIGEAYVYAYNTLNAPITFGTISKIGVNSFYLPFACSKFRLNSDESLTMNGLMYVGEDNTTTLRMQNLQQAVGDVKSYCVGKMYNTNEVYFEESWLSSGNLIKIKLSEPADNTKQIVVSLYTDSVYNPNSNHIVLGTILGGGEKTFKLPTDGHFIRLYSESQVRITADITLLKGGMIAPFINSQARKNIGNVLILGDSYSQLGNWINQLPNYLEWNNLVNLAVSSATLKDAKEDRTTYPYSSRPSGNSSAAGTDNRNTFACQIEKLKRLMAGTDLDQGETQIYTDASQYPDYILIQGGKNDQPDANATVDNYYSILFDTVNAYGKFAWDAEPTLYDVNLVKDLDDIVRTNFVGAMYYLAKSLYTLFPNAKIIFINPSNLDYAVGDRTLGVKVSSNMKLAAEILSIPMVDWNANGRLSNVFNGVTIGDGTYENPYLCNSPTTYTMDQLHPNNAGGNLLAKVVAEFFNAIL